MIGFLRDASILLLIDYNEKVVKGVVSAKSDCAHAIMSISMWVISRRMCSPVMGVKGLGNPASISTLPFPVVDDMISCVLDI